MKDEEIISNNLLIAEYMGFEIETKPREFDGKIMTFCKIVGSPSNYANESLKTVKHQYQPAELHYHCDWSWIMPVVEKIFQETMFSGEEETNVYLRTFGMKDKDGLFMSRLYYHQLFHSEKLLDVLYLSVVDFCKQLIEQPYNLPFDE